MEDILTDPNLVYLMLMAGLILAALAMISPGTGILEILALFSLLLAGWGVISMPSNSINWWALVILLISLVLFFISLYKPNQRYYLILSITALVVGSVFLFNRGQSWVPAVNPFLALAVSIFAGGFFWIAARKVMEARAVLPVQDLSALIGEIGTAKTDVHHEGSVQVAGELWTARSKFPIPEGAEIRVIDRDGFILDVEGVE
jgi:membrane-bound serine protease (ClpP class)